MIASHNRRILIIKTVVPTLIIAMIFHWVGCKKDSIAEHNSNRIPCPGQKVVEWQGRTYKTAWIGGQCWLAENMNWDTGNSWWFNHDSILGETYGRLYDWETAQYVCPPGWHLPGDDEWVVLEAFCDSRYDVSDTIWTGDYILRGYDVGKNLKSTSGWEDEGNGTDLFGFAVLPAGYKAPGFDNLGRSSDFWTSTVKSGSSGSYVYCRSFNFTKDQSTRYFTGKSWGHSVRCVRDQ